jgi:hypothetical protein
VAVRDALWGLALLLVVIIVVWAIVTVSNWLVFVGILLVASIIAYFIEYRRRG